MAPLDRAPSPAVVYESVNSLLEHALFVADDNLRGAQVHEALEPVIPIDYPAIKIVKVAGGEPAAVQLDHGAQLRREYRQNGQDHVLHPVPAVTERLYDAQPLDGFLAALTGGGVHLIYELLTQCFKVYGPEDRQNGLGAHAGLKHVTVTLVKLPVS